MFTLLVLEFLPFFYRIKKRKEKEEKAKKKKGIDEDEEEESEGEDDHDIDDFTENIIDELPDPDKYYGSDNQNDYEKEASDSDREAIGNTSEGSNSEEAAESTSDEDLTPKIR